MSKHNEQRFRLRRTDKSLVTMSDQNVRPDCAYSHISHESIIDRLIGLVLSVGPDRTES